MPVPLPLAIVNGHLQTSDGKPAKLFGCSDFAQFKRWLMPNGQTALVEPILKERTDLARQAGYTGPLVARVFRHAAPWNAFGITNPWSYPMAAAREFTQFYGEHGWYVDWTGGDFQICFPFADPRWGAVDGPLGINQHINEFCEALVGLPNVIWNTCNEPFKNGVDTSVVKPPPWAPPIQYSGTYYDGWTTPNDTDLAVINFHPDRSDDHANGGYVPKFVGKVFETAVYLFPLGKPIIYDEPIGADEVNIPGRRSNVPAYFYQQALCLGLVDGYYFHSTPGLSSDGFGPIVRQCWQAACRGAAAIHAGI